MPQIRTFAVQEGLITTVKSAVEAYGLKSIAGRYDYIRSFILCSIHHGRI